MNEVLIEQYENGQRESNEDKYLGFGSHSIKKSLFNQDSISYFLSVANFGGIPEDQDLYDQGVMEYQRKFPKPWNRSDYKKDRFIKFHNLETNLNIDPNKIFERTEEKRRILRETMNYNKIWETPVENLTSGRIGIIFFNIHYRSLKYL